MVNVIVEGAKRLLPHAAQTALPYMLPLGQVSGITVSVSDHVQLQSIVQVAYVMRPLPLPHPPHGALLQLGIIAVLGLGITEHVCEAGAAVQVTEEIGFEVKYFQVDIHLISHALEEIGFLA